MINNKHVSVVIPAKDEMNAIGLVSQDLLALRLKDSTSPLIDVIVVCDNGSTDATASVAIKAGARVVSQPTPGYGIACLTALKQLQQLPKNDIIVFIDGDHSFYAEQAIDLINAIDQGADLAIGSRTLGKQESGALTPPQKVGNLLASFLIRSLWKVPVSDLGPFRAISSTALRQLYMQDQLFGWTVEMQVKAAQLKFNVVEIAVDTRKRIGISKISGTVAGTIGAAKGILGTIFLLWYQQTRATSPIYQQKTIKTNALRKTQ